MESTRPLPKFEAGAEDASATGESELARARALSLPGAARLITDIAGLTASEVTLEEYLRRVSELLAANFDFDRIVVILVNPLDKETALVYPRERPKRALDFERALARAVSEVRQIVGWAASRKGSPSVPGVEAGPPDKLHALVAVPLLQHSNVSGVLILESHRAGRVLARAEEELAQLVALEIALVVEREQSLDEARRRMDQMGAFSAVASTVNEWVDVEQLAHRFLLVLLNTTATQHGLFYLLEGKEKLSLAAQFAIPEDLLRTLGLDHLALAPPVKAFLDEGRLTVLDGGAGFSDQLQELVRTLPMEAAAILPLRVKGNGIGLVLLGKVAGAIELPEREFVQGLADQAAQAIENARLYAESQRRFLEQSSLRELAQTFLSSATPEEVIERALDALVRLVPGELYEVLLADNQGGLALVNGRGWRPGVIGRTRVTDDPHQHAGYVLQAQSPITVDVLARESRFQASDYLMRHHAASGVCAPMVAETRVIGVLGVYSRTRHQFTEEQMHLLYLVATQTAMALEKARHSQEAARRLDELRLLNEVIVAANSEISFDRVLAGVTAEIGQLLKSEHVQVYLRRDEEERGGAGRFFNGGPEGEAGTGIQTGRANEASAGGNPQREWSRGIVRRVIESGEPLIIEDLTRDLRFDVAGDAVRACLGAPMMIGERVIGVIVVGHAEANAFDANDLRLLTTLAAQIATAIERARLLDETARQLSESSAMFELSNELRTATTEAHLLERVVEAAVGVLGGCEGTVLLVNADETAMQMAATTNISASELHVPRSGGWSWLAYETGVPFTVEDVRSNAQSYLAQVLDLTHGAIFAPLRTPTGTLGVLFVGFEGYGHPPPEKVRLATTIANLAAQSLQRLRLNEQTVEQAASLAEALGELETSYQATLLALSAALDARDRETEGHSRRVTRLALAIARQLKLGHDELTSLERGALLHDVGKIGISDNVLLKAGPLTPEERELMNEHPRLGYDMLKGIPFLQDALPVVLHHQEMYDGSGYPSGLSGSRIPLGARIFAVADAYDAMTSTRPYREAMSHNRAFEEILRCRGTQFDPQVVDAFAALFRE